MRPLLEVVTSVLRLLNRESEHPPVAVYSDKEVFKRLWSLDLHAIGETAGGRGSILLFWDRTPFEFVKAVRVANYLSPIDWAVAMSASLARQGAEYAMPRVVVLDPGAERAGVAAEHVRASYRFGYRPIPWFDVLRLNGPSSFVGLMSTTASVQPVTQRAVFDDALRNLWIGSFSRSVNPDDHHAIANVVGPRLLLGEVEANDVPLSALSGLLRGLGLLPAARAMPAGSSANARPDRRETPVSFPWFKRSQWQETIKRFVLVDDMAQNGWADFLRQALDLSGAQDASLEVHTDPSAFLNELSSDLGRLNKRGGLTGEEWDQTVLVLDLRLFQNHSAEIEHAFQRTLVNIASKLQGGFRFVGLKDLNAALVAGHGRRGEDRYLDAVALFPTLLAQLDPFLPIIVFSSTRQRDVIRHFAAYRNIILDFEKPVLNGREHSALLEESRVRFGRALERAVDITRARVFCRTIARSVAPTEDVNTPAYAVGPRAQPDGPWQCVHVFIDESGATDPEQQKAAGWRRNTFSVGGLCLFLRHRGDLSKIRDAMMSAGLVWGLAKGQLPLRLDDIQVLPTYKPKQPKPTGKLDGVADYEAADGLLASWMADLDSCVRSCGGAIAAFALEAPRRTIIQTTPDALYRQMLFEILSVLSISVLPRYLTNKAIVGVHVATRATPDLPRDPLSGTEMRRIDAAEYYGLHFVRDTNKYVSLGKDHVWPLVNQISEDSARVGGLAFTFVPARGVRLINFDDDEFVKQRAAWLKSKTGGHMFDVEREFIRKYEDLFRPDAIRERPEQIHYAADCVARLARTQTNGTVRAWFEMGFHDGRDAGHDMLEPIRAAGRGRPEESLEKLFSALATSRGAVNYSDTGIARWVRADAVDWVKTMAQDPSRFERLVNRLRP